MTTSRLLCFPKKLHRRFRILVVPLLAAAGLMVGLSLDAETPEPAAQSVDSSSVPGSNAVRLVFQGKLEESGEPVQRAYDFVFRLFTQEGGGLQVGRSLSVDDLAMHDGLFAVDLDFSAARLPAGGELWLDVAVRDHDLAEPFTALSPRQRLTGTPYALLAQGGDWSLIGVPVGGPPTSSVCRPPAEVLSERLAGDDGELVPVVARSLAFNGLDHTITASTVANKPFSRQIRIGFSDTPTPNPSTFSDIRVGIGTLTPQATLHVAGTTLFSGTAVIDTGQILRGSVAGGGRILGNQGNTPAQPAIGFFSAVGSTNDGGGGNGIFRPLANTMAFATVSQERMRLTSGGALGLATQTPTALLDVAGTARIRNLTGGPSQALVTAENSGTLHSIQFPNNASLVLRGNGTFGPVLSTPDNDWLGAGSGQMRAGFTSDRVAIGTTASTAKFVVASNLESPAALVVLSSPANNPIPIGLQVAVSGTTTGTGFGAVIQSSASNTSANNTGLRAEANSPGNINLAMEATASGATFRNTGLETKVSGTPTFNIGIRTEADGGQQAIGIFAAAENGALNRAGFFQGDIEVTGTIHNPSDRRLKREIQDLEGALGLLSALRPRSFAYRRDENPGLSLPEGRHFGLIAQELENVLPELVTESMYPAAEREEDVAAQPYKSVSYLELIPLLVRGLQEQQALLAGQEARIRQLEGEKAATSQLIGSRPPK